MIKFLIIVLILCLVLFIIQQSNLFETVRVMDGRLGVPKDETHINWDNLSKYFDGIVAKIKKISGKSH
ncbi:MAG TPA: hypothetical protein PL155_00305 [Candidatus Omnitrophota bacterium]|nr:hypothetical protein [Candidatus Omnitrophota bacterium]HPD85073.1 hypothetical protein [Candidatus Omnitrophota bacterium]HRZ03931.1 hypothetical protein [Candidatus Omnitrophota bacterium]